MKRSIKISSTVAVIAMLLLFLGVDNKVAADKSMNCCSKTKSKNPQEIKPLNYNKITLLPVVNFFDFN